MSGFVVTIVSSRRMPLRRPLSCASAKNFQPVSASGTVNVKLTRPSASVSSVGRKNAVSCRFFRAGTSGSFWGDSAAFSFAAGAMAHIATPASIGAAQSAAISIMTPPSAFDLRSEPIRTACVEAFHFRHVASAVPHPPGKCPPKWYRLSHWFWRLTVRDERILGVK